MFCCFSLFLAAQKKYYQGTINKITKLVKKAHELAGGEKDIAVYVVANENAIVFYEKLGMKPADDVMQFNHIDWTSWTVK